MNENPYAPPVARVEDHGGDTDLKRPRSVTRAVRFLWASFYLGIPAALWEVDHPDPELSGSENLMFSAGSLVLQFFVAWWLISAAGRGKGWSRWVQVGLTAVGLAAVTFLVFEFPDAFHVPWYINLSYVVTGLANLVGIGLLFTPSANAWYRVMKRGR